MCRRHDILCNRQPAGAALVTTPHTPIIGDACERRHRAGAWAKGRWIPTGMCGLVGALAVCSEARAQFSRGCRMTAISRQSLSSVELA